MSRWQRLMAQEVLRRQAGQGALAASFLWIRRRGKSQGLQPVQNKAGAVIGATDVRPGLFRIMGKMPGLSVVDRRYSVVTSAISDVRADIDVYIRRKLNEAEQKAMRGAAR